MNIKPYNTKEESSSVVAEPVASYGSTIAVDNVSYLSDDILIGAMRCAEIARNQNRMISNKDVYERLSARLEWK